MDLKCKFKGFFNLSNVMTLAVPFEKKKYCVLFMKTQQIKFLVTIYETLKLISGRR